MKNLTQGHGHKPRDMVHKEALVKALEKGKTKLQKHLMDRKVLILVESTGKSHNDNSNEGWGSLLRILLNKCEIPDTQISKLTTSADSNIESTESVKNADIVFIICNSAGRMTKLVEQLKTENPDSYVILVSNTYSEYQGKNMAGGDMYVVTSDPDTPKAVDLARTKRWLDIYNTPEEFEPFKSSLEDVLLNEPRRLH